MRHHEWMERDERSQAERYRDALLHHNHLAQLQARERQLMAELENVQAQLAKIPATPQR